MVTAHHTHNLIISCNRRLSPTCLRERHYIASTMLDCRKAAAENLWVVYREEGKVQDQHTCIACRRHLARKFTVAKGGNGSAETDGSSPK